MTTATSMPDTEVADLDLDEISEQVKQHHKNVTELLARKRREKENLAEEIRDLVAKETKAARAVKALDRQVK